MATDTTTDCGDARRVEAPIVMPPPNERVLGVQRDLEFLPVPNVVRAILGGDLPPLELITSASVYAFYEDKILLANLASGAKSLK